MIRQFKSLNSMTLAELMVVFFIIGVVASCTIGITKAQMDYAVKYLCYSAINVLNLNTGNINADGIVIDIQGTPDVTVPATYKTIPATDPVCSANACTFDNGGSDVMQAFKAWGDTYTQYKNCYDSGYGDGYNAQAQDQACLQAYNYNAAYTAYLTEVNLTEQSNNCDGSPNKIYLKSSMDDAQYTDDEFKYNCYTSYGSQEQTVIDVPEHIIPGKQASHMVIKALPDVPHSTDAANPGFCDSTVDTVNTIGATHCAADDLIADGTISFAGRTPTFVVSNGMAYYNFGAVHSGIATDDYSTQIYTVYVDIDGTHKGKSILNDDVMKFLISRAGTVRPAADSVAANSTRYLSASIRYNKTMWLLKSVSYRQAACVAGTVTDAAYCGPVTVKSINYPAYSRDTTNCPVAGSTCRTIVNKP